MNDRPAAADAPGTVTYLAGNGHLMVSDADSAGNPVHTWAATCAPGCACQRGEMEPPPDW